MGVEKRSVPRVRQRRELRRRSSESYMAFRHFFPFFFFFPPPPPPAAPPPPFFPLGVPAAAGLSASPAEVAPAIGSFASTP